MQSRPLSTPLLAAILAGLAMLGPFSIDTYLPSFPAIAHEFAVSAPEMQQTLFAYLIAFSVMTLFHGTLSDSFGRRPVILVSLVLYALASVGCGLARVFEELLLFRSLQGLSAGAGMVVGRAIIRDSFSGHDAQRLMSMVMMIFGLAPAIAPIIGGWLQSGLGWRWVFGFLSLLGTLLVITCARRLPETLPRGARQPFAALPLLKNYLRLSSNPRLLLLCTTIALNFCGFFLYIVSAPAFIYNLLGLGEKQFAWLFIPGVTGVMFGAYLSGRMAGRVSSRRTVKFGYAVMFGAIVLNLVYSGLFEPAVPWSVLPVMLYSTGMSLAMPSVTLIVLDLFPHNRGLTASLQAFGQTFFNAIVAGFVSPFLSHSALTLALGMGGFLAAGWLSWMIYLRIESKAASDA